MANPFWPNSEHTLKGPSLEDLIRKQMEHHAENVEAFAKLGRTVSELEKAFNQYTRVSSTELAFLQTYPVSFYDQGYTFNGMFVGDTNAGKNLIVTWSGLSWTIKLVAGFNAVNVPDGAEIKTDNGTPIPVIISRYNLNK